MYPSIRRFASIGFLTVLFSNAVVLIIRGVAVAVLRPPSTFVPLRVLPPILDTAVLVTWAVVIFGIMTRHAADPIRKFKAVALTVLLLSFAPDIALVRTRVWGATWTYAFVLMLMHVGAWATCVTMLTRIAAVQVLPRFQTRRILPDEDAEGAGPSPK